LDNPIGAIEVCDQVRMRVGSIKSLIVA